MPFRPVAWTTGDRICRRVVFVRSFFFHVVTCNCSNDQLHSDAIMSNNLCKRTHLPKYRVFDLACAYLEAYSPQRNVVQDASTCNSSNCLCRESPNNRLCPGVQSPWYPIKHTETKQTAGHVDNCHDSILYRTFCQLVTYNLTAPPFVSVHPLDYYTICIPVFLARDFAF
jgi:hypothetical protein